MKFFCEYCGNRIDANVDRKCPNCGASYRKNKKFIELEAERKKQIELGREYTQKVFGHVTGVMKFSKVFFIIPIIVFVGIFVTIISFAIRTTENFESKDKVEFNILEELKNNLETDEEKEVTVNFGEYGETLEYRVKVTNYKTVEDPFNLLEEGYEYVQFDLVVENLTDYKIYSEDVYCIVDGVSQKNSFTSGYSDLPFDISKKLAVTGSSKFIVSKSAKSYDIRYGDYVTIHIEK